MLGSVRILIQANTSEMVLERWRVNLWSGELLDQDAVFKGSGGYLSLEHLQEEVDRLNFKMDQAEVEQLLKDLDLDGDGYVSFSDFRESITRPLFRQNAANFLEEAVEPVKLLVDWLMPQATCSEIGALRDPGDVLEDKLSISTASQIEETLQPILPRLAQRIANTLAQLAARRSSEEGTRPPVHNSHKFSMKAAEFGSVEEFREGMDLGVPEKDIMAALRGEHSSTEEFTPGNSRIATNPSEEFEFVVSPVEGKYYSNERRPEQTLGRERIELSAFLEHPTAKRAGLIIEEVIALRLYTGPMYQVLSHLSHALQPYTQCIAYKGNPPEFALNN